MPPKYKNEGTVLVLLLLCILLWWELLYITAICLFACLLQIKAKQTWATTHHNTQHFCFKLVVCWKGVCVCVCVCFPGFHSCWVDITECMQVRTAHSGLQAAGSFVKALNGYHFL
jgi:hypothetical protein